jgi:hypothetical protein
MFQPLTLLVAVSLAQTAFSMPALPTGQRDRVALQKRDVTNLPTSLITCRMYTHIVVQQHHEAFLTSNSRHSGRFAWRQNSFVQRLPS